jgi:hypothetical protein
MDKEFKNIDDLLRNTLNNFEQKPNPGVWKRISSGLPGKSFLDFLTAKVVWTLAGAIAVLILIILLTSEFDLKRTKQKESEYPVVKNQADQNNISNEHSSKIIFSNPDQPNPVNEIDTEKNDKPAIAPAEKKTDHITVKPLIPFSLKSSFENQFYSTDLTNTGESKILIRESYLLHGFYPLLARRTFSEYPKVYIPPANLPVLISYRNSFNHFKRSAIDITVRDDYGKKNNFIYGCNLLPEMTFPGSGETNNGLGAEITGRYLINDFHFETGIGFSISENEGGFVIDYDQYDSIGYYYKVTSFAINENTGQPVFNTGVEAVFDTVSYQETEKTKNSYSYLYLPVYAGVRLYELKEFSMNLQAGIIYSILVSKKEPNSGYTNDKATQIMITNDTPSRISSNWILTASLGLQYEIGPKVSLNFEPMIKYYMKPVYERAYETKSTIGIELRAGLYFRF